MAAGLGYIEFSTGDVLTAAAANGYLASQVVMVFASAAARTSAIASPQEGMISYLKDTNSTEYYSGSAWAAIGGGGSGGMTLLSTTSLTGTSTTISSISQSYKHLLINIKDLYGNADCGIGLRFNGDTGSNYGDRWIRTIGSTVTSNAANSSYFLWSQSANNTDWSNKTNAEAWVWRYTDTSRIQSSMRSQGYNGANKVAYFNEGIYNASAAITSITVICDGASFSGGTAYLYGVN